MFIRLGFNEKWISWMRVCVFFKNPTMLVNGCPTQEIIIKRGLKQQKKLLAHFFFLLVTGRFNELVSRAIEFGLYSCFRVGICNLVVSHHQYIVNYIWFVCFRFQFLSTNSWNLIYDSFGISKLLIVKNWNERM